MTNRQPGDVVGLCPVCDDVIDLLNPEQVPRPESGSLEEHIAAIVAANEALILGHVTTTHSIHEVLVALGIARQALVDLEIGSRGAAALYGPSVHAIARRGLGQGQ